MWVARPLDGTPASLVAALLVEDRPGDATGDASDADQDPPDPALSTCDLHFLEPLECRDVPLMTGLELAVLLLRVGSLGSRLSMMALELAVLQLGVVGVLAVGDSGGPAEAGASTIAGGWGSEPGQVTGSFDPAQKQSQVRATSGPSRPRPRSGPSASRSDEPPPDRQDARATRLEPSRHRGDVT